MNIKHYSEFNSNESVTLLRGLEDLGVNDPRWTREQILDAIRSVDFEPHIEVKELIEWDWETELDGSEISVMSRPYASLSVTLNKDGVMEEFIKWFKKNEPDRNDTEQDRFTMKDIESAFDDVEWNDIAEDFVTYDINDVDVDLKVRNYGDRVLVEGQGTISWDYNDAEEIAADWLNDSLDSYA